MYSGGSILQDGTRARTVSETGCLVRTNGQQLHFEIQIRVGRDGAAGALGTVSVVAADLERRLFAQRHLHDAFVPTLDDLSDTNHKLEMLSCIGRVCGVR